MAELNSKRLTLQVEDLVQRMHSGEVLEVETVGLPHCQATDKYIAVSAKHCSSFSDTQGVP